MKYWNISQSKHKGDLFFKEAYVCAETKEEARRMHPFHGRDITGYTGTARSFNWVKDPKDVKVKCLGEAKPGMKKCVTACAFNGC